MHRPILGALALLLGGCVHYYQPMADLHRPTVIDPRLPNFSDVSLTVRCEPGDLITVQDASALCRKVATLFENQGATVATALGGEEAEAVGDDDDDTQQAAAPAGDLTGLTLVLRSRKVHASYHPLSWVFFTASFTVLPGVNETTFAQDVVVRDPTGACSRRNFEGRIVDRVGFGSWFGNTLADWLDRDKEHRLTGDAMDEHLSHDLYRQLSQTVFNAKMQWEIQEQLPARAPQEAP
ncbi:MAG: hypothetical protein R3F59_27850 [Myxococcota bacterium]